MSTLIEPPDANTSRPFVSWKVEHMGIRVPGFDAAVAWYTKKLDFQVKHSLLLGDLTYAFLSLAADDSVSVDLVAGRIASGRSQQSASIG